MCTYPGVFAGFAYGWCSFFLKSNMTSRKSVTVVLAVAVIFNPSCSSLSHSVFFVRSAVDAGLFITASPSSRYSPMFSLGMMLSIWFRIYVPTISHVSAPSYEPIVTSKGSVDPAFFHGVSLLNRIVCCAWIMISFSVSVILVNFSANSSAFSNRSFVMHG